LDTSFHAAVGLLAAIKAGQNTNAKAKIANAVKSVKSFMTNVAESFFGCEDELCLMAA
jgi:hypothetical protein